MLNRADTPTLTLRDYQVEQVRLTHAAIRAGNRRVISCGSTGMGKRMLAVWWAQQSVRQGKRVLIATDRRLLVGQMADELERFGVHAGVIMGDEEADPSAPVQVASIQTLRSRHFFDQFGMPFTERRLSGCPKADLVMIDECHKTPKDYGTLLGYYPESVVIGLTATPVDDKGYALWGPGALYDVMVEGSRNSQLIRDKWLLRTEVFAPSEPDVKGVKISSRGEYNQKQLAQRVQECTLFGDLWKEWTPYADRVTIVFAPTVAYAYGLRDQFRARLGPKSAEVIEAKTKPKDREAIYDAMREGTGRVLLSVDVLREGFDLPAASVAVDLQTCKQLRTFWQKVGRIKRPFEGQETATLIDMAGNYWRHLHPDNDPRWEEVSGQVSMAECQEQRRKKGDDPQPVVCPRCKAVITEPIRPGLHCPVGCGYVFEDRAVYRYVRQGGGKLKKVPVGKKPKKKSGARLWKSELYAGLHCDRSLAQCKAMYFRRYGHWPSGDWPLVPRSQAEGKRKLRDVTDKAYIERAFSRVEG